MAENFGENQKLFSETFKQQKRRKEHNTINVKDRNGKVITEESKIIGRLRLYFKELTKPKQTH